MKVEFEKHNLTWKNETHFQFFNYTEEEEYLDGEFKSQRQKQAYFDRRANADTSTYNLQRIQLIMADSKCFRVNENLISGPIYYKFESGISSELQQHFHNSQTNWRCFLCG